MHNAIMTVSMSIRHVPEELRDALAVRAAKRGQSLQEYVLSTLIEHARRPSMAELLERIQERKRSTESAVTLEDILARDEDLK